MSEKWKYRVWVEVAVDIEVDDEEYLSRCMTDEWANVHYGHLDKSEALNHLAFNAICNGRENGTKLDGWADIPEDKLTMKVDRGSFEVQSWTGESVGEADGS